MYYYQCYRHNDPRVSYSFSKCSHTTERKQIRSILTETNLAPYFIPRVRGKKTAITLYFGLRESRIVSPKKMPKFSCPLPDCTFETEDLNEAVAAVMPTVHANATHTTTVTQVNKTKMKNSSPNNIHCGPSEEWTYFLTNARWQDYAEATNIHGKEKVFQLLECCDENIRKDLTHCADGSLASKPITEVMAAFEKLAAREENTMVVRVALHNMQQDRDEPIRNFGARLRGQAGVCKFTTKCPNCERNVDYTEHIIRDVLTRGLEDQDIQLDLLG